jgi:hypothetical protein
MMDRSAPATGRLANRRGAVLVLIAVVSTALMALLVLVIDGGLIQHQRRVAQLAADAAAKAGAIEILRSRTDSVAASARSEAARNGFTQGVGGRLVVITYPSINGSFSGAKFLQVTVRDSVQSIFAGLFGRTKIPVNASSRGGVTGTNSACITSLSPTLKQALLVHSDGRINAVGCNVSVNSNNAEAMRVADNGSSLIADKISVTGGYFYSGGTAVLNPNPPTTGAAPVVDPLAAYVTIQVSDTSGACIGGTYKLFKVTSDSTIYPGNYCGGIDVANNTGFAHMAPGTYVMKGGGFTVESGARVIGNGPVTIINVNAPAANNGAGKFDVINFGSAGSVSLSAPISGRFANILFFTPLNQGPAGHVQLNRIHSDANATLNGSLYFPDQYLEFSSGGTLTINGGLVASSLEFGSDARVNVTGFAGSSPYGLQKASLVQ